MAVVTTARRSRSARPAPPPRTQRERRATTRRALLDATVASLVANGQAGTTTTVVARRAGVSQGALFKHFPTKQELLASTVEHLYDELLARYLDTAGRLPRGPDRLDQAIRLLWSVFLTPELAAARELHIAARTDPALRGRLLPVVARHGARLRDEAARLFPDLAGRPEFALLLDLTLETMQGMALSRIVDDDETHYERLLDHLTGLAHVTLGTTRRVQ